MDGPKAKLDVISSFILRHLEDSFRQMKLSHPLPETSIEVTAGGIKYDPAVKDRLSAQQWAVFRTRLYQLAVQLPALLFNAGVTDGLLSADKIHITAYKRYIRVQVEGYGLLVVDLEGKKFHARLWESVDNPVNGRKLRTDFGYTAHEAYKTLLKMPACKDLINDSPAAARYNTGTAMQRAGNLPGVKAVPRGKQLVEKMANDQFQKDDLLMIDVAEKTPASERDDWRTSFAAQPPDTDSKPYEYAIHIKSGQLSSEYLKLNEVGVIYINPAK
jgi:hypothetical protein